MLLYIHVIHTGKSTSINQMFLLKLLRRNKKTMRQLLKYRKNIEV